MIFTDYGVPLAVGGKFITLPVFLYKEVIGLLDFSKGTMIGLFLLIPAIISFLFDNFSKDRNYFVKFNPNNLIGKTLMFNFANYNVDIIEWKKRKKCKVCGLYDSK